MKSNSILFVGCGDLGVRAGVLCLRAGMRVAGLRRDPSSLPEGFSRFAGDYTAPGSLDFIAGLQPDYVVATLNPSDRSVAGYDRGFTGAAQNLVSGLGGHRPKRVLLVSSTRVYAERNGAWVDEHSALAADDPRALAIIAAERAVLAAGQCSVIRFGGIYGYPGGRLLERIRRGELAAEQPVRFTNRIHRDDCAGFLHYLVERAGQGAELAPVYNGVDDLPAPQFEVDTWLAAQLGVPPAPRTPLEATGTGTGDPISTGHKRCSNRLLHASGYRLLYPDYRSGYRAVLAGER